MFLLLRSVCSIRITEPHTTNASISLPRFTTIDSRFKDIKRFQVCRRNGQSIILCHNASLQRAKITELCHWLHFEVLQRLQWSRIIWQRRVYRERVHYHSAHTQSNQSTKPKGKNNNKHSLSDRRIGSKQFIQWRRRLVLVCPAIDRLQLHLACILELGHHFTQMRIVKENAQHRRHTRSANKWQPQFASRPASQSCT